jgi:hypothetical protein
VQKQVHFFIKGETYQQIFGLIILIFSGIAAYIIATFTTQALKKDELRDLFSKV